MVRIIMRATFIIALIAAIGCGIYFALATTVDEISIRYVQDNADEGVTNLEIRIDKFNSDNLVFVVKNKLGEEKVYKVNKLAEELPEAVLTMPESFSLKEDEAKKTFPITVDYDGLQCSYPLTISKGLFDGVKVTFGGEEIDESGSVSATYTGSKLGVELLNLPAGTEVTATDKDGNAIENYNSAFVDAGTYEINFVFSRESYVTASKKVTFKIEKKEIKPEFKYDEFEFTANPVEIDKNFGFKKDGKGFDYSSDDYTLTLCKLESDGTETPVDAAIELGNYRITVTDNGTSNYTFKPYSKDFTIYKEYHVTFRQKGVPDVVVAVRHGETVTAPKLQSVKGYDCSLGWNWGERSATDPVTSDFTVEANMKVITYKIEFVIGDSEKKYINMEAWKALVKPTEYTIENASTIMLPIPEMNVAAGSNSEYYFDGWYNGNTAFTAIPEGSTGDIVLTAKAYEIYKYNYTVDGEAKVVVGRQPTIYNLEHEDRTALGYKFMGWTIKDNAGKVKEQGFSFTDGYPVNEDGLQFESDYDPIEYKIYFRGNKQAYMPSHPTVAVSSTTYNVEQEVDLSQFAATYAHCDFIGWSYNNSNSVLTTIPVGTVGEIQLYANWEQHDVNLVYSSEDKENVESFPADGTVKYYSTLTMPASPSRYGYNFLGWSVDGTEEGIIKNSVKLDSSIVKTKDDANTATIYAVWSEQIFKYTFSDNDRGLTSLNKGEVKMGENITLFDPSAVLNPKWTDPETGLVEYLGHEGKLFAGWKILGEESGTEYKIGDEYTVESDVTFVPVWVYIKYSITFNSNANGDTTLTGTLPVWPEGAETRYTSKLNLPATDLWREHFVLAGWSEDKDAEPNDIGVFRYDRGDKYEVGIGDKTLYAVWEARKYTVNFEFDNGVAGQFETYSYGTEIDLSTLWFNPEYVGYELLGWSLVGGDGTILDTYTVDGQATLKCEWKALENTLVFNTGYGEYAQIGSALTLESGETITVPGCALTDHDRRYYEFKCWVDSVTGVEYYEGDTYVMPGMYANSTRALEAVWTPIKYRVEFVDDASNSASLLNKDVNYTEFTYEDMVAIADSNASEYPLVYTMMKLNLGTYIFDGWYDENGNEITSISEVVISKLYDEKKTVCEVKVKIEEAIGFTLKAADVGYMITGYNGANDVKLPTHHKGEAVVEIGSMAFFQKGITSVTFARLNNITAVANGAFLNCASLKSVYISKNVATVGEFVFWNCASDLVIKLEAAEAPEGFVEGWNGNGTGGEYTVVTSATR